MEQHQRHSENVENTFWDVNWEYKCVQMQRHRLMEFDSVAEWTHFEDAIWMVIRQMRQFVLCLFCQGVNENRRVNTVKLNIYISSELMSIWCKHCINELKICPVCSSSSVNFVLILCIVPRNVLLRLRN